MPLPAPDSSGAALRRLGGGRQHCGHSAGGGASTRSHRPNHRIGPPLPMTAPNDASSAPKTLLNRRRVIAARKKDHTVKNVLLVNVLSILFLSDTYGGPYRDAVADATPYPLRGAGCYRIWASWRSRSPRWRSQMPTKKPRGAGHHVRAAKGKPGPAPASAPDRACQQ